MTRKRKTEGMKTIYRWLQAIAALSLLSGCSLYTGGGSISIRIVQEMDAKTIVPVISMDIDEYHLTCTGPGDPVGPVPISVGTTQTVENLVPGEWSVTIQANNASGIPIGQGTTTATVVMGAVTTATVVVRPMPGDGSMTMDISWTGVTLDAPNVTATMEREIDGVPTSTPVPLTLSGDSYSTDAPIPLAAGYYLLTVRLYDGSVLVWDRIEAVRIVFGENTHADFPLTEVHPGAGNLQVSVLPDMHSPISIGFDGDGSPVSPESDIPLAAGTQITVTATTSQPVGTYQWYINGQAVIDNTTNVIVIGDGLANGYYRYHFVVTRGPILSSSRFQVDVAGIPSEVWGDGQVVASETYAGESVALAVDSEGHLHASWEENDSGIENLVYATNAGGAWSTTVLDTRAAVNRDPGIAVDLYDNVHICYLISVSQELLYTTKAKADISWPPSPEIVAAGMYMYGHDGSIAVDPVTGVVHVAYEDGPADLYHAHNAGGTWNTEPAYTGSGFQGQYSKPIAIDADGFSHIVYYDGTGSSLRYATNESGGWQDIEVDNAAVVGNPCDMAIDPVGTLHVAYFDDTNNALKYVNNISGVWGLPETIVASGVGASLALDVNPATYAVHIAYLDTSQVMNHGIAHVTNASGSWVPQQIGLDGAQTADLDLAVDNNGHLHLLYRRELASGGGLVYRTTAP